MDLAEKYSGYKDATGYCPLHIPPPDTGIPTLRYRGVREHKRTVVVNQYDRYMTCLIHNGTI